MRVRGQVRDCLRKCRNTLLHSGRHRRI